MGGWWRGVGCRIGFGHRVKTWYEPWRVNFLGYAQSSRSVFDICEFCDRVVSERVETPATGPHGEAAGGAGR